MDGTKWIYVMNRKAGSKTWLKILKILEDHNFRNGNYTRVRVFTYVRHPYGRLVSGYEEIIQRHVALCKGHCAEIMKMKPGLKRFEAFVRFDLGERSNYHRNDHLSYHVASQMDSIARFSNFDFVGHLETMRDDVLASIGSLLAHIPELDTLLDHDVLASRFDRVQSDQNVLFSSFDHLSPDVKNIITTYYDQDFFCFNYSMDNITDLPWHRHNPSSKDHYVLTTSSPVSNSILPHTRSRVKINRRRRRRMPDGAGPLPQSNIGLK